MKKKRAQERGENLNEDEEDAAGESYFKNEMQRLAKRMNLRDSTVQELMKAFSSADKERQKPRRSTSI